MAKKKEEMLETETEQKIVSPNDVEWTDHVLGLLKDDEKIMGNPTTDGLRRIFEQVMSCAVISADSSVVQAPSIDNEKRATVVHSLTYVLTGQDVPEEIKYRTVSGAADVYWGNCDKIYRNHPVAVAETRAEGRALRRALKLRKVVAAEELTKEAEDDINGHNINKINNNQINFIDLIAKRLDIDVIKLLKQMSLDSDNIYRIDYDKAAEIAQKLTSYQQDMTNIPEDVRGYVSTWK